MHFCREHSNQIRVSLACRKPDYRDAESWLFLRLPPTSRPNKAHTVYGEGIKSYTSPASTQLILFGTSSSVVGTAATMPGKHNKTQAHQPFLNRTNLFHGAAFGARQTAVWPSRSNAPLGPLSVRIFRVSRSDIGNQFFRYSFIFAKQTLKRTGRESANRRNNYKKKWYY